MIKQTFSIKGMSCASCAVSIETYLKQLAGVTQVAVNFANDTVIIEYDPAEISPKDFKVGVAKLGDYDLVIASPAGNSSQTSTDEAGAKQAAPHDHAAASDDDDQKRLLVKLIWGGILAGVSLLLGFSRVVPLLNEIPEQWVRVISFLVTTPVVVWVGATFYVATYKQFKKLSFGMSSLIGIGTGAAYLFSTLVTFAPGFFSGIGQVSVFFDSAAVIIFLVLLGRYLENKAKKNTTRAIHKLLGLKSKQATIERDGREMTISVEKIKPEDKIIVRAGEKIPVDGVVLAGSASVDESMVTGESVPALKQKDAKVIGGTLNKNGRLVIRAVSLGADSFLDQIIKLVEEAQNSKAPIQRWVDQVSKYFVPIVMAIAILSFILWLFVGTGLPLALIIAVSVLVIACPCALGLATPTAIITGTGRAATQGILFRNAESLERLHKAQVLILDKTGTITEGQPRLEKITGFGVTRDEVGKWASALAKSSVHPLSTAVVKWAKRKNIMIPPATDIEEIAGAGIRATLPSGEFLLGNLGLLEKFEAASSEGIKKEVAKWEQEGFSVLYLARAQKVMGLLGLRDQIKKDSRAAIEKLKKMGLEVIMMSGDNEQTAKAIAKQVGIEQVYAPVLPGQKAAKVSEIDRQGQIVAMVGDGINDAPALAGADIGIAMGAGTDIAIETADITLLGSNLSGLVSAFGVSKKTVTVIKQNLVWALGYNTLLIPIAAGVLYPSLGILINPIFAAGAMALSSLSVVLNSLRLNQKFARR